MQHARVFFIQLGATMASAGILVGFVAFTTIPWNLGQHPGEVHQSPKNEIWHVT